MKEQSNNRTIEQSNNRTIEQSNNRTIEQEAEFDSFAQNYSSEVDR
ncbi:MAG: hypothetical protein IJP48_08785 [Synergistaceae bacterium]|nr:hypothetical protein [Synergistaceae bacterium]